MAVLFCPNVIDMQQIFLDNVAPGFLQAEQYAASEIWNKKIHFEKGDNVQIVAPSGTGKTSLIHFIYGLRKDYTGTIELDKLKLSGFDVEQLASMRQTAISVVFQDLRLFLQHSVKENILVKSRLGSAKNIPCMEEMCDLLGIASKLEQTCGTCSYGEQQRVAIIRALQQPFDFILLDEPFSHLDEKNRMKAMSLIEQCAIANNAAIIFADLKPIEFFKATHTYFL